MLDKVASVKRWNDSMTFHFAISFALNYSGVAICGIMRRRNLQRWLVGSKMRVRSRNDNSSGEHKHILRNGTKKSEMRKTCGRRFCLVSLNKKCCKHFDRQQHQPSTKWGACHALHLSRRQFTLWMFSLFGYACLSVTSGRCRQRMFVCVFIYLFIYILLRQCFFI